MTIVDDVDRNLANEDYSATVDDFLAEFSSKPWNLSVGTFGTPAEPGISDIDALLVVEDGSLYTAHAAFKRWVADRDLRKYLFAHPPIILTPALLPHAPHLHTLENLSWKTGPHRISSLTDSREKDYLNLVWATSFVPTMQRLLQTRVPLSLRYLLLVLKSVHKSQKNLHLPISAGNTGSQSQRALSAVSTSQSLRSSLRGTARLSPASAKIVAEVESEFHLAFQNLLAAFDAFGEAQCSKSTSKRRSVRIAADILLTRQERSSVLDQSRSRSRIAINHEVFDLIFSPWEGRKQILTEAQEVYRHHVLEAFKIFKRESKRYEFVLPFGYPIHLNRAIQQLRIFKQSLGNSV